LTNFLTHDSLTENNSHKVINLVPSTQLDTLKKIKYILNAVSIHKPKGRTFWKFLVWARLGSFGSPLWGLAGVVILSPQSRPPAGQFKNSKWTMKGLLRTRNRLAYAIFLHILLVKASHTTSQLQGIRHRVYLLMVEMQSNVTMNAN
jgi:hypothetical protein